MATGSAERARRVPPLHLVTNDELLADPAFVERAARALRAGGEEVALHLRGPLTGGRRLFDLAARLAETAGAAGALLLVNDRVDVALAAGAHGAQLGARSLRVVEARALLGSGWLLGASVHTAAEALDAVSDGADFLIAGTLFPSASHPARPGSGTGWLAGLRRAGVPVIGIGGITPERVPEVLAAGAHGVAAIRSVWQTDHVERSVHALLTQLTR